MAGNLNSSTTTSGIGTGSTGPTAGTSGNLGKTPIVTGMSSVVGGTKNNPALKQSGRMSLMVQLRRSAFEHGVRGNDMLSYHRFCIGRDKLINKFNMTEEVLYAGLAIDIVEYSGSSRRLLGATLMFTDNNGTVMALSGPEVYLEFFDNAESVVIRQVGLLIKPQLIEAACALIQEGNVEYTKEKILTNLCSFFSESDARRLVDDRLVTLAKAAVKHEVEYDDDAT